MKKPEENSTLKRCYQRPTAKVIKLNTNNSLLTGSGVTSSRNGYGNATEYVWNWDD